MSYMHGNEYWPDLGEDVFYCLDEIRAEAAKRGFVIVCFNRKRERVNAGETAQEIIAKLGF